MKGRQSLYSPGPSQPQWQWTM